MNISKNELYGKAEELLKQYGKLSTAFLMRKLKIDFDLSVSIMEKLGQDIWVTAEEYVLE